MSSPSLHPSVTEWVDECARLTLPERIHWCDGSDQEYHALVDGMLRDGTLLELDPVKHPGAYPFVTHEFADMARGAMGAFVTQGVPVAAARGF